MSRVSNALNMYLILQIRGLVSVKDLASELEVSERMIKGYKKDLEMAGIYIASKAGRYGGYYLEKKRKLEGMSFTESELSALKMAKEAIKSGNFHYSKQFEVLASKILITKENGNIEYYHNKTISEDENVFMKEKKVWAEINLAINKNTKIVIKYKSLKENGIEIKNRTVHPYGVFDYKGATYFYGYCEVAKDIRFFKLSRIINYYTLKEKFGIKIEFDFEKAVNKSFGIYTDKELNIKLEIFYPMSEIIMEKKYAKSQKITKLDEKTILFEAKMSGYVEIKSWLMSMGSKVKVIQPEELREDIINETKKILEIYQ